jgi:sec-independent protein translocase protein TatA
MPGLGPVELIIILTIVVVVFGAGRLSDLGGALGKGIREFPRCRRLVSPDRACPACAEPAPEAGGSAGACGQRL